MNFKLGYFKVNSVKGQFSFTATIYKDNLWFKNFKYHPENIKEHNIIYCNIVQKKYDLYNKAVMDYISKYIEYYFELKIDDFKIKKSNLMGYTVDL